jgi:hypothetical protein
MWDWDWDWDWWGVFLLGGVVEKVVVEVLMEVLVG